MSSKIGRATGPSLILLLALASCQHTPTPSRPQRVAVLRFENLTPDVSLDWMGRAFSEALTAEWSGAPGEYTISGAGLRAAKQVMGARPATAPGISSERGAAIFSGATRIVTGDYVLLNGRLRVHAAVEDLASGRTVQEATAEGPLPAGMIPLADTLARELGQPAMALGTTRQEALRAYATALDESDYAAASRHYAESAASDPDFGLVYPVWAETALEHQDRAGAQRAVESGLARGTALAPLQRARLELMDASLRNDTAGQLKALAALERLTPEDASISRTAGRIALSRRDYPAAVRHLRRACELEPANVQDLNQLAYAQAYTGDVSGATATLRRYQALRPRDANPLDSLGDVNLHNGQYAAAEKFYLEAQKTDAGFLNGGSLLKAAWAHLLTGDLAGADALFRQLIAQRKAAGDVLLAYREADWAWTTGRRHQAIAALQQFADGASQGPLREMASRAYSELGLWELELGDRDAAKTFAERALSIATPGSGAAALVVRALCEPPASVADWQKRVERLPVPLRDFTLSYALLFAQDYSDAVPVLQRLYQTTQPENEQGLPVLLAWAQASSGNWQAAAPLVERTPIPQSGGLDEFSSLWFPRLFYVRGLVLEKQGKSGDARQNYDLFRKLSGPAALVWDEPR